MGDLLVEAMIRYAGTGAYGDHYADGRPGGWPIEAAAWNQARRVLADELERAFQGKVPTP